MHHGEHEPPELVELERLISAFGDTIEYVDTNYDALEGAFALRLCYEGQTRVAGRFQSPTVTVRFGAPDPYSGIAAHTASTGSAVDFIEIARPAITFVPWPVCDAAAT